MERIRVLLACLLVAASSLVITASSCHKSKVPHYPLSESLRAAFGYKVGSYWVYKDSVSGEIDSFYVYQSSFYTDHEPGSDVDMMGIGLRSSRYSPIDSEKWFLTLIDSSLSIGFINNVDYVEGGKTYLLCEFPFKLEPVGQDYDSGFIANIFPTYIIDGKSYDQVILSYHTNSKIFSLSTYEDQFFISSVSGIVKVRFNHPEDSVFRVLELQRYNIVK